MQALRWIPWLFQISKINYKNTKSIIPRIWKLSFSVEIKTANWSFWFSSLISRISCPLKSIDKAPMMYWFLLWLLHTNYTYDKKKIPVLIFFKSILVIHFFIHYKMILYYFDYAFGFFFSSDLTPRYLHTFSAFYSCQSFLHLQHRNGI